MKITEFQFVQSDKQLPIAYYWKYSRQFGSDIQKGFGRDKNLEGSGVSVVRISGSLKFIIKV